MVKESDNPRAVPGLVLGMELGIIGLFVQEHFENDLEQALPQAS